MTALSRPLRIVNPSSWSASTGRLHKERDHPISRVTSQSARAWRAQEVLQEVYRRSWAWAGISNSLQVMGGRTLIENV